MSDFTTATAGDALGTPEGTSEHIPSRPAVARLTERQAIVLTAFTGKSLCPLHRLQEAVDLKLDRVTYTHQYGTRELWDEIKEAFRDEAIAMLPDWSAR